MRGHPCICIKAWGCFLLDFYGGAFFSLCIISIVSGSIRFGLLRVQLDIPLYLYTIFAKGEKLRGGHQTL